MLVTRCKVRWAFLYFSCFPFFCSLFSFFFFQGRRREKDNGNTCNFWTSKCALNILVIGELKDDYFKSQFMTKSLLSVLVPDNGTENGIPTHWMDERKAAGENLEFSEQVTWYDDKVQHLKWWVSMGVFWVINPTLIFSAHTTLHHLSFLKVKCYFKYCKFLFIEIKILGLIIGTQNDPHPKCTKKERWGSSLVHLL